MRNNFLAWTNITSDTFILNIAQQGLKLSFTGDILTNVQFEYKWPQLEQSIIDEKVRKLIRKKVIITTFVLEGDFSNLFIQSKKDGSYHTILNFKKLNQDCETTYFKMESIKQVMYMIKPNMYLASLYTVPIYEPHRKYLKFMWLNKAYQFILMLNGYVDTMRIFNKILRPPFCWLREQGFASVVYVDDTFLAGETHQECCDNIYATMSLLQNLGFTIHPRPLVLGFVINTQHMKITLTNEKKVKIH